MTLLLLACASDDPLDTGPVFDPNPIVVLGGERPASVQLPTDYSVDREWPLVVMLHGFGANATLQDLVFGLGSRVDSPGFILVKPEGTEDADGYQFWNATEECCDFYGTGVDDVAYLTALVDEAEITYPVSSVTFVGHSNGGYMSYRLACEIPERIDRIVVLAGAVYKDEAMCVGTTPVSVVHIHGTADDSVGYESTPDHAGAEESIGRWATKAGCDSAASDLESRDYFPKLEGAETTRKRWTGCEGGLDLELWTAAGGDHTWFPNESAFKDDVAAAAAG